MARKNVGGKSFRIDVVVSPELYREIEKFMKANDIGRVSEVTRIALAELVGQPDLAEGMKPGRRWPKKKSKK